MSSAVVGEFAVNFVREHHKVVFDADARDFLQLLARLRGAGRVAGKIHHQHLRAGRDFFCEFPGGHAEIIRCVRGHGHRDAVCEHDARIVADVARLVVEHFVAGVQQCAQCEVNCLADAYGDDDFRGRIVADAEMFADILRDALAQLGQAEVARVAGVPALQRIDGRLADAPRCVEVRLADAERDHVLHGLDDFKKVADARARNAPDVRCDVIGKIHLEKLS